MFIHMPEMDDFLEVTLNIYVGNQLVQSQRLSAPDQFVAIQFLQLCQQTAQQKDPYKVEMIRYEPMYDQFEGKIVKKEYKMTYWNKQETW